jgi:hydroxymethylpyrimidine pyrophosphatase-like HAD family hydrolase
MSQRYDKTAGFRYLAKSLGFSSDDCALFFDGVLVFMAGQS